MKFKTLLSMSLSALFFSFLLWVGSCKKETPSDPISGDTFRLYNYSMKGLETRMDFVFSHEAGFLENRALDECSGLVACSYNDHWVWAANDGGDINRLFLVDIRNAGDAGFVRIPSAGNRDAEDLALDWTPVNGQRHLYWGDIGDNNAVYPGLIVYRFPEPHFDTTSLPLDSSSQPCERLTFVYEDGARDAESLIIDPLTHDLYIVTKRENKARLYTARFPFDAQKTDTLKALGEFPISGFVAADISRDGRLIAVKTYGAIYCWDRSPEESLEDAFMRAPKQLPYKGEVQGESFAWLYEAGDESPIGYATVSEGAGAPLRIYKR